MFRCATAGANADFYYIRIQKKWNVFFNGSAKKGKESVPYGTDSQAEKRCQFI